MGTARPQKPFTQGRYGQAVGAGFVLGGVCGVVVSIYRRRPSALCKNMTCFGVYGAAFLGVHTAMEHAMVTARPKYEPTLNVAAALAAASGGITSLPFGARVAVLSAFGSAAASYAAWAFAPHMLSSRAPEDHLDA